MTAQIARDSTDRRGLEWPVKYPVCGVPVSATTYDEVIDLLMRAAEYREPAVATFFAAHAVVTASDDASLLEKVKRFAIVAPDGQPVRWALNRLHDTRLPDRVYGPEVMRRLCERAAGARMPIYLYGSASEEALESLRRSLLAMFPHLVIAGAEVPPFRPLGADEDAAVVKRIADSGARIVFIGLGCPKQDHFAADHAGRIAAVQVCVGAAFDFLAGRTRMAPAWMQRRGLEWLFRLAREPRRLAPRYLATNPKFLARLGRQWLASPTRHGRRRPSER